MKLVDATYDSDEWQLVLVKPNMEMNTVGLESIGIYHFSDSGSIEFDDSTPEEMYKNMLAAAPIHPSIRDHVGDENKKLKEAISFVKHKLEAYRTWGGMSWHWQRKDFQVMHDKLCQSLNSPPKDKP